MGIKGFAKLLNEYGIIKQISIADLAEKRLAFDGNLFIYKTILAMRKNIPKTNENYDNMHIFALTSRLITLKKFRIKSIFVFDSSFDDIKKQTMDKRKRIRDEAPEELKITSKDFDDFFMILNFFGFPIIFAKEEADSQCAMLSKQGLVDYIVSDDPDILLFGSNNIVKNFTTVEKKKMDLINTEDILTYFKITHSQLIELCLLLGTDYAETIAGVGPKRALNLILTNESIEKSIKLGMIPKDYSYKGAIKYFESSPGFKINKKDVIEFMLNYDEIIIFFNEKGMLGTERCDKICDKIREIYIEELNELSY